MTLPGFAVPPEGTAERVYPPAPGTACGASRTRYDPGGVFFPQLPQLSPAPGPQPGRPATAVPPTSPHRPGRTPHAACPPPGLVL